jgi:dUTP pyrophosphatase
MIEIKFKKEHPNAVLPKKAHESDAGFDVVAVSVTIGIDENEPSSNKEKYIEYDLGFSTEIPNGYKGIIVPRSSISKYDLIMCNSPAQIDASYRGSWKIRFKLLAKEDYGDSLAIFGKIYAVGDKIAQIFFEPILPISFIETDDLSVTKRNTGGFGSTDK